MVLVKTTNVSAIKGPGVPPMVISKN
jgi:serine/threonine protein kinase